MSDYESQLTDLQARVVTEPAAVLEQAEATLGSHPDPRLFRIAAEACRKLGLEEDAESAELAAIQAALSDKRLGEAAAAQGDGRASEALELAERVLAGSPTDLLALTVAAEAKTALWQLESAERDLREVLARAPSFLRASMLLATCLAKQLRPREACTVLAEVASRKPRNVPALNYLALLSAEVREQEEAVAIHERLVSIDPRSPERRVNLAQHYRIVGRRAEAIKALQEALQLDPSNGSAWWSLANYFPNELPDDALSAMAKALAARKGSAEEGSLHLAIGLIQDRKREYRTAFDHFVTGKRIRLDHQPYNPDPISSAVDDVIRTLTPEFVAERSQHGYQDYSPIFIIGMPRSGTTLVERMLGRHSAIEGTGELPMIQRLAERARHEVGDAGEYAAILKRLPDDRLTRVGEEYVRASKNYRLTDKPRFIDKNNLNWMHIGLILLALPNARILDVRREPLDCCWANFKMLFADGFPATNDLAHVGKFYADYVRLLDAMAVAAPGRILQVRYESVVDNAETQLRRMVDFLGLPFEVQCLEFHLSTDAVATASSEQVRQPLNRSGVDRWKPYAQWLQPLRDALGPLAHA